MKQLDKQKEQLYKELGSYSGESNKWKDEKLKLEQRIDKQEQEINSLSERISNF